MIGLLLIASATTALGAGLLYVRARALGPLSLKDAGGPVAQALLQVLREGSTQSEEPLWSLDQRLAFELPSALSELADLPQASNLSQAEEEIEAALRVLHRLPLTPSERERVLSPYLSYLRSTLSFMDRPLCNPEWVREGELLDRTRMVPLSSGTHVRQALGLVVRTDDGRIVSRAKVICA